jgi:hypothetical protein
MVGEMVATMAFRLGGLRVELMADEMAYLTAASTGHHLAFD